MGEGEGVDDGMEGARAAAEGGEAGVGAGAEAGTGAGVAMTGVGAGAGVGVGGGYACKGLVEAALYLLAATGTFSSYLYITISFIYTLYTLLSYYIRTMYTNIGC